MKVTSEFDVERVHEEVDTSCPESDNRVTMASCQEVDCQLPHEWAVYKREEGLAIWQSDHDTFELAKTAAIAYAGASEFYDDLTQQLSASIMDCLALREMNLPDYIWGTDRSQIYVDVARMAREATISWQAHHVAGVIYEVSEGIANACLKSRGPIDAATIDAILKEWEGIADE